MNPKQIVKIKFLDHNFLMLQNGNRQAVLAIIDIFIAFLFMSVLACQFYSFYAIFTLKFPSILTKDFHCLNSSKNETLI